MKSIFVLGTALLIAMTANAASAFAESLFSSYEQQRIEQTTEEIHANQRAAELAGEQNTSLYIQSVLVRKHLIDPSTQVSYDGEDDHFGASSTYKTSDNLWACYIAITGIAGGGCVNVSTGQRIALPHPYKIPNMRR